MCGIVMSQYLTGRKHRRLERSNRMAEGLIERWEGARWKHRKNIDDYLSQSAEHNVSMKLHKI